MSERKYTEDEQHVIDLAVSFNKFRQANTSFNLKRYEDIEAMLKAPLLSPVRGLSWEILYGQSRYNPVGKAAQIEDLFKQYVIRQALERNVDLASDALEIPKDELNVAPA